MYEDFWEKSGRGWVAEREGEVVAFYYADKVDMRDIKELVNRFWEAPNLFQVSRAQARAMGFTRDDAYLLENIGIPAWAAPNLHFHPPKENGSGKIIIGEDRDGLPLIYDRHTGRIFVYFSDDSVALMAISLGNLVDLLVEYAQMVERAMLENGDRAFIDNNLPDHLIDAFERFVRCALSSVNSAWNKELYRLRSHARD